MTVSMPARQVYRAADRPAGPCPTMTSCTVRMRSSGGGWGCGIRPAAGRIVISGPIPVRGQGREAARRGPAAGAGGRRGVLLQGPGPGPGGGRGGRGRPGGASRRRQAFREGGAGIPQRRSTRAGAFVRGPGTSLGRGLHGVAAEVQTMFRPRPCQVQGLVRLAHQVHLAGQGPRGQGGHPMEAVTWKVIPVEVKRLRAILSRRRSARFQAFSSSVWAGSPRTPRRRSGPRSRWSAGSR